MDWRVTAIAAVSEGFCPVHKTPLIPEPQGGWCPACGHVGAWWSVKGGDTVVTAYPPLG